MINEPETELANARQLGKNADIYRRKKLRKLRFEIVEEMVQRVPLSDAQAMRCIGKTIQEDNLAPELLVQGGELKAAATALRKSGDNRLDAAGTLHWWLNPSGTLVEGQL